MLERLCDAMFAADGAKTAPSAGAQQPREAVAST
jgi:hypothetical protein